MVNQQFRPCRWYDRYKQLAYYIRLAFLMPIALQNQLALDLNQFLDVRLGASYLIAQQNRRRPVSKPELTTSKSYLVPQSQQEPETRWTDEGQATISPMLQASFNRLQPAPQLIKLQSIHFFKQWFNTALTHTSAEKETLMHLREVMALPESSLVVDEAIA